MGRAPTNLERFKMLMESGGNQYKNLFPTYAPVLVPKIRKMSLRDDENLGVYFEPRVVSLGPFHHDRDKYQQAEQLKHTLPIEFVDSSGNTIQQIVSAIFSRIQEFRGYFEEEVTKNYDDTLLAWMLSVDGCAILQFISFASKDNFEALNLKSNIIDSWAKDLFLLENQVPYCLLELLMSLSRMKNELMASIDEFIKTNHFMGLMNSQKYLSQKQAGDQLGPIWIRDQSEKPIHLLDLLRTSLLGPARQLNNGNYGKHSPKQEDNPYWQSYRYRNLQELKAAGIHVKSSRTDFLRDISFSRRLNFYPAYLCLPPLKVDEYTGPMLWNLIAYEMSQPNFKNDVGITSYISFLGSLIDETDDIKDLRKARILYNFLDSDKEVVQLIRTMCAELVPDRATYKHVKCQIQEYYEKPWMPWMVEFSQNYFRSPWTVFALFGALFVLAMSATQTWYTVYSPASPCDDFCNKFIRKYLTIGNGFFASIGQSSFPI